MTAFEARYPGTCSDCEESIRPGEQIFSLGGGEYEHVACRRRMEQTSKVCETCWVIAPCFCTEAVLL